MVSTSPGIVNGPLADYAALPVWIAWRYQQRNGQQTKPPYKAKTNDPTTWRTLSEVAALQLDGVGIMLGIEIERGWRLGGLDLDVCLDADGNVAPWAQRIVTLVSGYTEVSPSGRGLKIYFLYNSDEVAGRDWRHEVRQPNPPGVSGKEPGIELYFAGRYFAVTGNLFEDCYELRPVTLDRLLAVQELMEEFEPRPQPRRPVIRQVKPSKIHHGDAHELARVLKAIERMPNPDLHFCEWSKRGMAIWRATKGSTEGYNAFVAWSKKSSKFTEEGCTARWDDFTRSPPTKVDQKGSTIFYYAGPDPEEERAREERKKRRVPPPRSEDDYGTVRHG